MADQQEDNGQPGALDVAVYVLRHHQMLHMGQCSCGRWRSSDSAAPKEVHRQFIVHRAGEIVSYLRQMGHIGTTGETQWGYQYKAARPDAKWGPIANCQDRDVAEESIRSFRKEVGASGAEARLMVRVVGDWTPVAEGSDA